MEVYAEDRDAWRAWLESNHGEATEVWLIYHKKSAAKPSVSYEEAVEEALCFGWIDSTVRTIDEMRYKQKFTPRKPKSVWSDLNKRRVAKLKKQGRMTKPGLAAVTAAKRNGEWDRAAGTVRTPEMPPELKQGLAKNKKAKAFFDTLAPSYKRDYMRWIAEAKRAETKARRTAKALEMLEGGKKRFD